MLIAGEWKQSQDLIAVTNPYSGQQVGSVSNASVPEVQTALHHAKQAAALAASLPAHERSNILARTAQLIRDRSETFASSICSESGLTLKDARNEVKRALNVLKVCAEEALQIRGETLPLDIVEGGPDAIAMTVAEPLGLVCAITPFNRPLNQVVVKVGPAFAAGNSIILKPSEKTPLTALLFARTMLEAGLPPAVLSVVTGKPETIGDLLVTAPEVDMVTFTGSSAVGESISRKTGMIKLLMELGDSGALIVLRDADIDQAVLAAAAGAYSTSGQSCRGVKRIFVDNTIADAFVAKLKARTVALKTGDPQDPATDIGCLISENAAIEVEQRIQAAVREGATIVAGGARQGAQIFPTLLDRVSPRSELVTSETFAPCAPVIRIGSLEEAVMLTNDSPFGLQTGIFTNDLKAARYAIRHLKVGGVMVNFGPQFESPNIPFGGVKKSGLGREGIRYAIREMMNTKIVILG